MQKEIYTEAEMEVISFEGEDIITTSEAASIDTPK